MKSKLTNFLSLAVVILVLAALFTVSAFAEISGDFGKIVGLDSTKTYEAAPATINAAGNALAIGEYSDVSASTTGLAGLYYVREVGDTSDGTLVYVYGDVAGRQAIGKVSSSKAVVSAGTNWTPETFVAPITFAADNSDTNWHYIGMSFKNKMNSTQTGDALTTARAEQKTYLEGYSFKYSYASNEIIHASELVSFGFLFRNHATNFSNLEFKPRVEFVIAKLDGTLERKIWYGKSLTVASTGWPSMTVDAESVLKGVDGYVVGVEVFPWNDIDTSAWVATANRTADSQFKMCFGRSATRYAITLPKAEAPVGLSVNGKTVSGFDSNYNYVAVPITINGADNSKAQDITPVDGKYVFDADTMPGLWGVAIKGDGEYYMNSDTSAPFYIKGSAEARQKIGTFASGATVPAAATITNSNPWVDGKFVTTHSLHQTISETVGAYSFHKLYFGINKNGADILALVDAVASGADENVIKEKKQVILGKLLKVKTTYMYSADEIIPANELLTFSTGFSKPQGMIGCFVPTVTFYLIDEAGEISTATWTSDKVYTSTHKDGVTKIQIDTKTVLPQVSNKWVVGVEIMPWGGMTVDTLELATYKFETDDEIRLNNDCQVKTYFYYGTKDYVIKQDAPTPELSSFPIIGGGFGQISGFNRDYLYEYKYSADGTTWPDNWIEITANSTALNVTDAGYYRVRAKDTTAYGKSDVVEIRVVEYEGALDELPYTEPIAKMYLPNDFVELQAEYEIDVTVKNWISTLALQNISTVSPDSVLKINGKNHKFVVKASNIEVDETVHYYNMSVSLFGESRHNVNLEKFKELAGDAYVTDIYFESSKPLPFKEVELYVYLGTDYEGMDVELNLYNEKINRLRSVETASVYEGWATFTNCAETYVVVIPD